MMDETDEASEPAGRGGMNSQGIGDPGAAFHGGTSSGGAGPSDEDVIRKSPSRRASGAGSKQPTKRTSANRKKAGKTVKKAGTPTLKVAGTKEAARKKAATRNNAAKRAAKTGASRKRLHERH